MWLFLTTAVCDCNISRSYTLVFLLLFLFVFFVCFFVVFLFVCFVCLFVFFVFFWGGGGGGGGYNLACRPSHNIFILYPTLLKRSILFV